MYPSSLQQPNLALLGHPRWNMWTNVKENNGILSNASLDYRYQYKRFRRLQPYVLYTWWVGLFGWYTSVNAGQSWATCNSQDGIMMDHVDFKQISEVVESHDICWNLHRFNCSFFPFLMVHAFNPESFLLSIPRVSLQKIPKSISLQKKSARWHHVHQFPKYFDHCHFPKLFPGFFSSFQLQPPPTPPILVLH